MGYSCTVLAGWAVESMLTAMQARYGMDSHGTSNGWGDGRFYEQGREQGDGAVTGSIIGPTGRRVGSVRVASDGVVESWPGSNRMERENAARVAVARHIKTYGWPLAGTYREDHPAADLLTAKFVCV